MCPIRLTGPCTYGSGRSLVNRVVWNWSFSLNFTSSSCAVWWQYSWNGIWYLIEHSLGVVTGFGYVVVYFFRLTLELQYDMWYIISSLAIVVSLFRLHMCQFPLNKLFFYKIPGSLYSVINCFILTNSIAAISTS